MAVSEEKIQQRSPKAGPIFQQAFSLPENAQTLAGIAFRAAGKSGNNFPAASKLPENFSSSEFRTAAAFSSFLKGCHSLSILPEIGVIPMLLIVAALGLLGACLHQGLEKNMSQTRAVQDRLHLRVRSLLIPYLSRVKAIFDFQGFLLFPFPEFILSPRETPVRTSS